MVHLDGVTKRYQGPQGEVRALDAVSLRVEAGEFLAIRGASGSGKSTLLLTIGAMVRPTAGRVMVAGTDLYALSPSERARFRAENIGFVFQLFHLVPYLSVLENVLLPTLAVRSADDSTAKATALLERFGLSHRMHHRPSELSIGERQRAAMARALLNRPRLILADEPTGNLDPDNATEVMNHLAEFHREGATIVVVTHEELAARYAQRTVLIRDGRIVTPNA
ncbi:MAG TPA: ABC transporter ATP-binding protein [Planctomycetota bacterium]|nr:ABC transporter ATP-binding protein [Planctomycetota bacterium]HRR81718.1 ABC transporter ATP-binding protein [Planctomycetota bacterium]HRT95572.1 ABC transporter ATP-binding protein [Planctomycetota bacterium]